MGSTENSDMVHRFFQDEKEIILIATAHVSKESADLVKMVVEAEKPDTVCVELCQSRFQALRDPHRWKEMDIVKVIKEKKAFLLLSNLLLASFQRRIANRIGIKPGQEMITAMDAADRIGAEIYLADRDIRVTMSRAWRAMGLWAKLKLMLQLLLSVGEADDITQEDIEELKQADILQALLADVEKSYPVLRDILIDERDQYLCRRIQDAPGNKIVAVVGAGHVPGIKKYLDTPIDLEALDRVPAPRASGKILKWVIPMAICAVFIWGFFSGGVETGGHMIRWWFLANGILAGLGALLALAHPLTIAASVLAAPFTSLNPLIAAGWVSGLVETFARKPKVRDFENLTRDILSVKGFWRNKITRILLVVVLTNLGSSLGTFVAIPLMLKVL